MKRSALPARVVAAFELSLRVKKSRRASGRCSTGALPTGPPGHVSRRASVRTSKVTAEFARVAAASVAWPSGGAKPAPDPDRDERSRRS